MFPINRCRQRVATILAQISNQSGRFTMRFQSIGVASEWRRGIRQVDACDRGLRFPINRCRQRVATRGGHCPVGQQRFQFPINRCRQRVATAGSRALAAQAIPKVFARSSILAPLSRCSWPVENPEIACAAGQRAAPRDLGRFHGFRGCALRSACHATQWFQPVCPVAPPARSSAPAPAKAAHCLQPAR
jgi:hypothetical protein